MSATMTLSAASPTTAPPSRNIMPVRTAMVTLPTNPLCFRATSYETIRTHAMTTIRMHSRSNVNRETTTDPPSMVRAAWRAALLVILPDGIGRSGWAVLSIS